LRDEYSAQKESGNRSPWTVAREIIMAKKLRFTLPILAAFLFMGLLASNSTFAGKPNKLIVNVIGDGHVLSDPQGIDCPDQCSAKFPDNSTVSLIATAAESFEFVGWEGSCAGSETTCELYISGSPLVTAEFQAVMIMPLDITEAFADQDAGTLVLVGGVFTAPVVTFGDDQIELSNITVTESVLTTDLPNDLIPGDYVVQITEGTVRSQPT